MMSFAQIPVGLLEQDAGGDIPIIDVSFPMVDVQKKV